MLDFFGDWLMRLAGDASENKTRLELRCEVGRSSTILFPDASFQVICARSWPFSEASPRDHPDQIRRSLHCAKYLLLAQRSSLQESAMEDGVMYNLETSHEDKDTREEPRRFCLFQQHHEETQARSSAEWGVEQEVVEGADS